MSESPEDVVQRYDLVSSIILLDPNFSADAIRHGLRDDTLGIKSSPATGSTIATERDVVRIGDQQQETVARLKIVRIEEVRG